MGRIYLLFDGDILVDGDRCMPILLDNDGIAYYPTPSKGALDSVTLEQIEKASSAGVPVREARLTLPMLLRASEMIVLGSGLGVQALGEIDGRQIGQPNGRLYQRRTILGWFDYRLHGWAWMIWRLK